VVVVDDDEEIDRVVVLGEVGTERGGGEVGAVGGEMEEGDLDDGLWGNFGGPICFALFIASPQSNASVDAVVGLTAQVDETFSNDSSKLLVSPLSPVFS
jgi:hypothetical protein